MECSTRVELPLVCYGFLIKSCTSHWVLDRPGFKQQKPLAIQVGQNFSTSFEGRAFKHSTWTDECVNKNCDQIFDFFWIRIKMWYHSWRSMIFQKSTKNTLRHSSFLFHEVVATAIASFRHSTSASFRQTTALTFRTFDLSDVCPSFSHYDWLFLLIAWVHIGCNWTLSFVLCGNHDYTKGSKIALQNHSLPIQNHMSQVVCNIHHVFALLQVIPTTSKHCHVRFSGAHFASILIMLLHFKAVTFANAF